MSLNPFFGSNYRIGSENFSPLAPFQKLDVHQRKIQSIRSSHFRGISVSDVNMSPPKDAFHRRQQCGTLQLRNQFLVKPVCGPLAGFISTMTLSSGNIFRYDTSRSYHTSVAQSSHRGQMIAPPPIQQSSPTVTGWAYSFEPRRSR